jgi:hypothetical protein
MRSNSGTQLTASNNVAVGYQALLTIEGAAGDNTAIGSYAGNSLTSGAENLFLGSYAGSSQTTNSNLLIIDNQDRGTASAEATDSLIYGQFNSTVSSQRLTVNGTLESQFAIKVGTSAVDEAGAIRWTGSEFQGYDGSTWASLGGSAYSEATSYPGSPTQGEIVYRTDLGVVAIYTSDGWIQI